MSSEGSFEKGEGGSQTFPCSAGNIKKGHYMLIKDNPCKIVSVSTSKTGKHGHAKSAITGIDIFTSKKCEDSIPSSHNVDCPNVVKTEYSLINIDGDYLSIMDEESGDIREDLRFSTEKCWNEVNEKIAEDFEAGHELLVTVLSAMGKECIVAHRKV